VVGALRMGIAHHTKTASLMSASTRLLTGRFPKKICFDVLCGIDGTVERIASVLQCRSYKPDRLSCTGAVDRIAGTNGTDPRAVLEGSYRVESTMLKKRRFDGYIYGRYYGSQAHGRLVFGEERLGGSFNSWQIKPQKKYARC